MRVVLRYTPNPLEAELPWNDSVTLLDIRSRATRPVSDVDVAEALAHPIGMDSPLFATVKPGERVALVVSDSFRRTGIDRVLPLLLADLNRRGIDEESIFFLFATGVHRAPTPEEQAQILGLEVYKRFADRAFSHNAWDENGLTEVGTTSRGTTVRVNRRLLECDRIYVTGTVVMHYFAGFGGGRKSIVPGLSGADTISQNHSLNLDPIHDRLNPNVRIGVLDGNPVAEDMQEGASFVPVDGIINTVLDKTGEIAALIVGDIVAAHRAATNSAADLYGVPLKEKADLVIASAGPVRNFIQAHKALYNAYQAMKPGGRILFVAPCAEGLGGETFTKWLRLGDRHAVFAALRRQSEINGQTALSTLEKTPSALFVTEMSESDVRLLGGRKAPSLEKALDQLRTELPAHPTICFMPHAEYTVPIPTSTFDLA
ncbi:MAG TPA: nickel-dependent lactate racemase [Candidatus Hydrogenedentes bacterium]|nr:nickel-dependent lactate racemase [Candidatus Hydrogenedentota bacterium]HOL76378.1 nickel-dependent lactate racemase [Candidatus Hydrogenedentota bacterium]HPO85416.1 nickel-dependent lactate racemase [Candidatus Hydrogenedentota bacterium]